MSFRFRRLVACALFGVAVGAVAQVAASQSEHETSAESSGWACVVIKLHYADAEQIADVLRQLLPSTVRVTAYPPTNSVLIAGDPAILQEIEMPDDETEQ